MAIQEDPSQFQPALDNAPALAPSPGYIDGGRTVEIGRGWEWIAEGYRLFRRHPGLWILLTVVFFAIVIALRVLPLVGGIAVMLLVPVLVGGVMAGCQSVERGAGLELAHLFAGYRHNTGQLMLLGLIGLGLTLAAMLPVILLVGPAALAAGMSGGTAGGALFGTSAAVGILLALALFIPVNMALWFAPALVMLQDERAPRALLESFKGCLKNILPFLIYGVIVLVLGILAALPLGLGWLVLAPIVFGSVYAAYRDIYFKR